MKIFKCIVYLSLSINICNGQTRTDTSVLLKNPPANKQNGWPASQAYNFSGINSTGQIIKLSDYKGKYVLLDFWASWCRPCRAFNPDLVKLYKLYKSEQIEFIGIAHDVGKENKWRTAILKDNISIWPQILDVNISSEYSVYSIPVMILIDPSGQIIHRFGGMAQSKQKLKSVLENIFNSQ